MNGRYRGIFVTDLDGTLLRDGRISEADLRAFRSLGDRGIMRVIATGRSLHSAKICLADDFPADYLILSTGNQIVEWSTQEVMRSSFLSGPEVLEICHFLHGHGLSFMVHEEFPHSHRFEYHRGHKSVADFDRRLALYAEHCQEKTGCPDMRRAASQIVVIVDGSDAAMHDRINRELGNLSVIRATSPLDGRSVWIEIFAANVSKASGIMHLVNHHDLQGAPIAAIGNDHNDRDMLEFAQMPFKVADAFLDDEEKYITTPEKSDAVAFAIAHYMETFHAGMTDA